MSSLPFIKKISINSAILNQNKNNLNDDRIVTLQTTVEQTAVRGENPIDALQGLRLRILVATNSRCAQVNDFVSQRLNEYIDLGDMGLFMPEDRFIRTMDQDLQNKLFVDFFDTNPFGPYVSYDRLVDGLFSPAAPQINAPSMGQASRNVEVPLNTIMYDVDLASLLPRDPVSNDVARPRYMRASSTDLEPYTLAPIQISLNSSLPNIVVPNEVNLEQLTFYAFIYVPSIPDGPGLEVPSFDEIQSINTGMSKIEVANVRGIRTLFPPISQRDYPMLGDASPRGERRRDIVERDNKNPLAEKYLFVPDFMANAEILNPETRAKEGDIFQVFNVGLEQEVNNNFTKIYDLFYGDIFASNLFGGRGAKNIIQDDNFFSDFYLSRDMSGNARYAFAFDIRSFLAKNSYFPYLYLNKYSSDQLIQGTGLLSMAPRSRVLSTIMKRRRVEKISQNLGNNLGTDSRTVVLGPDGTFPIKYLDAPRPVKVFQEDSRPNIFVPEMSTSKIIFYEGEDIFGKERIIAGPKDEVYEVPDGGNQENGEFQYGAFITVFDNAPEYVRRLVNLLRSYRSDINQIYDTITLSSPTQEGYRGGIVNDDRNLFNYTTTRINVRLNDIETFVGDRRHFVSDILSQILFSVDKELQSLVNLSEVGLSEGSVIPYFQRQFEVENVDPRSLLDLDNLIGLLIGFFIGKLTEIFPKDPYGELVNHQPNTFESPGYSASEIPLKTAEMWFSNTFSRGETYHYGNDFVFQDKSLEKQAGLNSLSIEKYQTRVEDEFRKYFQSLTQGMIDYNQIPEPYLSPATQYFTPAIIQSPRAPLDRNIVQPDYASRNGNRAAYDINEYAVLFADIGKLHFQNHYLDRLFNTVHNPNPNASPNVNLFSEVLENLSTYYSTDIEVGETQVYQAPEVQRGDYPTTVPRSDYTLTLNSAGPFQYLAETPPTIPTVVGGPLILDAESITETTYRNLIDTSIGQNYDRNKIEASRQNKILKEKNKSNTPIKLPFAIFGEIFVDPEPIFDVSYQDRVFNSLTKLASTLGITSNNAIRSVEDFFGGLPNQTKSALVLAASNKVLDFGAVPNGSAFDAVRAELQDKDSGEREDLISYYETREAPQNDIYPLTRDPAKVYAKFMTFWMNYKNIAVVEYLSRYGNLNTSPENVREIYNGFEIDAVKDLNLEHKTALPEWLPLTPDILSSIASREDDSLRLLCRVRLKSAEEIKSLFDSKTAQALEGETVVEDFFAQKSMIVLTTYNKYFFLQADEPEDKTPEPRENPPKSPPPQENPPKQPPAYLGGTVGGTSDIGVDPRAIGQGGYK